MTDIIGGPLPLWAEILTAVFAVAGAAFAAIGSFGLVRLPSFFMRIHAPTLGSTLGAWSRARTFSCMRCSLPSSSPSARR
jgi:multicomponent K+:H+ antiporter subunit G